MQARLIQEAEAYHLAREKRENNVIKQHQQKIADIDSKIENLISTLENVSQISAEYINCRIETLHREKQLLIHQYSEALTEFNAVEIIPFTAEDWENMSFEDRRDIAKSMIDRVVLSENGVDVRFK